ncbi:hypothetical protein AB0G74_11710 [Streptomyces sp. NPDC020875]|uniref:hypothetical protein n=1 Tax=Streptomyces sp. NPDC020875 TaxID=3154898 RepID=UPI0033D9E6DC
MKEWPVVAGLAAEAGTLVRDALVASEVWESLPGDTRAGLRWCLADAREIGRTWPVETDGEEYGPRITALCMDVAYFAALYDPSGAGRWPEADPERTRHARLAAELLRQWEVLPVAWQATVLRNLHHGARVSQSGRPTLAKALAVASAYARKGEAPPLPDYDDLRAIDAPELVHRVRRLPRDWRIEVFRRIGGGADPMRVEAEARTVLRTTR